MALHWWALVLIVKMWTLWWLNPDLDSETSDCFEFDREINRFEMIRHKSLPYYTIIYKADHATTQPPNSGALLLHPVH